MRIFLFSWDLIWYATLFLFNRIFPTILIYAQGRIVRILLSRGFPLLCLRFVIFVETLSAISLPDNTKPVPEEISRVLACNCQAAEPCKRGNCSCKSLQISCTVFCKCYDGKCANPWTVSEEEDDELIWLYFVILSCICVYYKCICWIKLLTFILSRSYSITCINDVTVKGMCYLSPLMNRKRYA